HGGLCEQAGWARRAAAAAAGAGGHDRAGLGADVGHRPGGGLAAQRVGTQAAPETDLRSLKQTLHLDMLRCQSPDMIARELSLAITGYNLVRAVMNTAAEQNRLDPRRLSFSRAQDVVNAALPGLEASQSPAEYRARLQRMIQRVACCK